MGSYLFGIYLYISGELSVRNTNFVWPFWMYNLFDVIVGVCVCVYWLVCFDMFEHTHKSSIWRKQNKIIIDFVLYSNDHAKPFSLRFSFRFTLLAAFVLHHGIITTNNNPANSNQHWVRIKTKPDKDNIFSYFYMKMDIVLTLSQIGFCPFCFFHCCYFFFLPPLPNNIGC